MNKRWVTAVLLLLVASSNIASARATTKPVTVRGGFVNDIGASYCNPQKTKLGPGTPPGSVNVSCTGGSLFNGAWTGHTVITLTATIYSNGNIKGTFDEWFYGVYTANNTYGGLLFRGRFSIDGATGGFQATSRILGGTCAFAGSSGNATYNGHSMFGGYIATWAHPGKTSTAPCNPFTAPTLP